ncbi:hypothetical protein ACFT5B_11820 [Luteimicrobium sp. NPDC057192]|uniref:hypothetical protein n=1 Tax=Luteimicrobium sp. NPDC057192 TaxID=3346042 RepID=UPI00363EFFDD
MNGRIDFSGNRYFGSQEHHEDRTRLVSTLIDAVHGVNGAVALDVIDEAVALCGSEMVSDVVSDARYELTMSGASRTKVATLNALVATACAIRGVTR